MASLTLAQIDALLAQIAGELEPAEVEGLRAALLMRVAKPSNTDKLRLSVELMPTTQKASVDSFLTETAGLNQQRLERGKADLLTMTDDEWNELIAGENGEGNA